MTIFKKLTIAASLSLTSGFALASQVSAPFVDAGTFSVVKLANGNVVQSQHFVSQNGSGDHQFTLTGAQSTLSFINTRNSFYAFDVSNLADATSATLRLWAWAENGDEIIAGVLRSTDPSETLQLNSVDNYTASQIMDSPLGDKNNHAIDVPIWDDLGDGTVYGTRVFTEADEDNPGLIPNPLSDTTDCSTLAPGKACGRFVDIDMTAALADINAETGTFIFGASVADITATAGVIGQEQMTGAAFDLSQAHQQNFNTPQPQLLLTTVPVPAAVWLFGSGLLGLIGVTRRRTSV